MTERDAFEVRFHAAVRGYAARVSSDLDAVGLAHRIAVAQPRRSGLAAPRMPGFAMPRLVWVLFLVASLLAATVGGMLIAGSRPQTELGATLPWPSEPDRWIVDPPSPLVATGIAAVSGDEAWATDGERVWHFVDGAWEGPYTDGLPPTSASPFGPRIKAIAVAPDGTLWGALGAGPAAFRDGAWRLIVADQVVVAWKPLAVGHDGTVWVGTGTRGFGGYVHRIDGRTGEATMIPCGYPSAITVAGDGALYVFGTQWGIGHQLWAIRDGHCDPVDPPGTSTWVDSLATDPAGGVVAVLRNLEGEPDPRLARFDGRLWTVLESYRAAAGVAGDIAGGDLAVVDPAGGIWRLGPDERLWRFDGRHSVEIDAPVDRFSVLSMAPDGVIWLTGPAGVTRLRPAWDETPSARP